MTRFFDVKVGVWKVLIVCVMVSACGKDESPSGYPQTPAAPSHGLPMPGQMPMQVSPTVPTVPQAINAPVPPPPAAVPTPATVPVPPAAPSPGQQPANNTTNPLAGVMGILGAMQGQPYQNGAPAVQAIHWKSLTQALPMTAPGWKMDGEPAGESAAVMGFSVANASCRLTQGNMAASVEIMDTTMNPLIAMPFTMARSITIDSSDERMGPINFGTYPGTQKFSKLRNEAEIMVMVRNRVLITVTVSNAASEAAAVQVMQYVNFNHLGTLVGG